VLGELAALDDDLALAAGLPAAADAVHIHPELPRRLEQRRALDDAALPAGGLEDDCLYGEHFVRQGF